MALFGSVEDHIPAQNEAGADFAEILRNFDAGLITGATAIRQINTVANDFVSYTNSIGSDRAKRGGAELRTLADSLIAGINVSPGNTTSPVSTFGGAVVSGSVADGEQSLSGGGIIVPFTPQRTGAVDTLPTRTGGAPAGLSGSTIVLALVIIGGIYGLSKL